MTIKQYLVKILRRPTTEDKARKAGVIIGGGNKFYSEFWSTEPYLITVGNHCQITAGVKFFTHGGSHILRDEIPEFDTFGKITVGDWVYIGNNTLVMPGVTIGNHVLIAAGSVVTKSIPSGVIVGGNPAKIICSIDEYRSRNLQYNTNSKCFSTEDKKSMLLNMDDDKFIKKPFLKQ